MIRAPIARQLSAAHEAGHAIARLVLFGQVGEIQLREDGSGSTHRAATLDVTKLAEAETGEDGLTLLEAELIACHAGCAAEERWRTAELPIGSPIERERPATRHAGDAQAIRFLRDHFPRATALADRDTRVMAVALLDEHWPAVQQLVTVLCARPLPATLSGAEAARIFRETLARKDDV